MFNLNVNLWLECLAPRERGAFDLFRSYYVLSNPLVPRAAYDTLWVAAGGAIGSARYDLWLERCGAQLVVITDPDGNEVEYYQIDLLFWSLVNIAAQEPPPNSYPCAVKPPWTE